MLRPCWVGGRPPTPPAWVSLAGARETRSRVTPAVAGHRGLWHHRDFRRLWVGETVSQFGTTISQVALPLLAILVLHASTFEVGLLTTLETLAFLLVGLPAGAWVDRMRFRSVLIANDLLRAALLGSIPVAHLLGVLTLAQLYIVTVAVGVCTVFFDVAYQSYLPTLIDRRALVDGDAVPVEHGKAAVRAVREAGTRPGRRGGGPTGPAGARRAAGAGA